MTSWLEPLLCPGSIAIVGASERDGSLAASTRRLLVETGYSGAIYSINPKYPTLYGETCYADLAELPQAPDLVVYAISGLALERSFDQALTLGVGGIVIYASNYLEENSSPRLSERLRLKAGEAGIPVIGGNSMGFYNYDDGIFVSFDRPPPERPGGHIGLIMHSGSGMTYLANNDARFCYNYVIASGQETNATVADYIDFLLERPSTRVIGIMLETVRDPAAFMASLQQARLRKIPVVIVKLGRTEKSARLALSHSGGIVGDYQAFEAACERYGAILCKDLDEMIVSAMLFATGYRVESGGLASMLDSGGLRELMIDLADDYGVEFADISAGTRAAMQAQLESGLEADNPLDAMGALGRNTEQTYLECGRALLDDPQTGLLSFEFEFRDGFSHYPVLFDVIDRLAVYNHKPLVVINSSSYSSIARCAAELTQRGIAVINGIDVALRSIRNLLAWRDYSNEHFQAVMPDRSRIDYWRDKLASMTACDEITSLQLMADFELPVVEHLVCEDADQTRAAAGRIGYPLVMKTAEAGIAHKSDCGGVMVSIDDPESLDAAYQTLKQKLGARVVVMPMIENGVEVSLGMKNDSHYGPMVIVASGGIFIELIGDRSFRLAPVSPEQAAAMLDSLKLSRLLDGLRGRAAIDRQPLIDLIVRFSGLAHSLSGVVAEIDLNPVIVTRAGCHIVDALLVTDNQARS